VLPGRVNGVSCFLSMAYGTIFGCHLGNPAQNVGQGAMLPSGTEALALPAYHPIKKNKPGRTRILGRGVRGKNIVTNPAQPGAYQGNALVDLRTDNSGCATGSYILAAAANSFLISPTIFSSRRPYST